MLHVAVLLKPYLDLILSGRKTVECRLTKTAREPFEAIEQGERIFFKISAGPFAATAVADHVIFEEGLTPKRIREIKRDYNDAICGEAAFWEWKSDSRYCSLIWLRDVQATTTGPEIRPLQGKAWLAIDDSEIPSPPIASESFSVEITAGNLRNNTLYVSNVMDRFPRSAMGGRTKRDAGKPVTLKLQGGSVIETDIVQARKLVRARIWGQWFRKHNARPGDRVVFTPVEKTTYKVRISHR